MLIRRLVGPTPVLAVGSVLALAVALAPGRVDADGRQEIFTYLHPSDRLAFDVQLFEPSPSPRSIAAVELGSIPSHLALTVGLWTNYAYQPFVVDTAQNGMAVMNTTRPVVGNLWQSELHVSLGLFEYLEVGAALPLVYTSHVGLTADQSGLDLGSTAAQQSDVRAGDLRLFVRAPILRGAWPLAARLEGTIPLGGADAFAGNISWTLTPALALSHAFGPVTAAVNLGYRFRQRNGLAGDPDFVLDDELVYGLGARWSVTSRLGLNAELLGRVGVSDGSPQANRNPLEVLVGGLFQVNQLLGLQLGFGRGLTSGYGSEAFRVYAGARVTATRAACAFGPEDYDGFQDGDYCADPDNDGDGIPDVVDRCPNDPEDFDGYLDTDGCPDPDNDSDGILDPDDRCPLAPEDHDGFQDADGCPDDDNDEDGVPDLVDDCPNDPEDIDNYQDADGCPEPGPDPVVVTRSESHLLLSQRVFFDYNSDTIRSVSLPILNEVARTLSRNPDITRMRIEGYTDGVGDRQYNLDLSYRRARAVVEYLVTQGVPREHLEFQGYGASQPVAADDTPEGQALNRRVEFTILSQAGTAAASPAATPAATPAASPHRHHHAP